MARIARALGAAGDVGAARGLYDLEGKLGTPRALKDIGMPESGLDKAADLAAANPYANPVPIERAAIRQLLDNAFHGREPA
jgi:maleylacetate reductase